jgi:hypothetical protein
VFKSLEEGNSYFRANLYALGKDLIFAQIIRAGIFPLKQHLEAFLRSLAGGFQVHAFHDAMICSLVAEMVKSQQAAFPAVYWGVHDGDVYNSAEYRPFSVELIRYFGPALVYFCSYAISAAVIANPHDVIDICKL